VVHQELRVMSTKAQSDPYKDSAYASYNRLQIYVYAFLVFTGNSSDTADPLTQIHPHRV